MRVRKERERTFSIVPLNHQFTGNKSDTQSSGSMNGQRACDDCFGSVSTGTRLRGSSLARHQIRRE